MPLDGTNYKVKVEPLQTGLAGLKQLGDALRWQIPHDFTWNFAELGGGGHCGSYGCAVGFARTFWPAQVSRRTSWGVAEALALPRNDLAPIFGCGGDIDRIYGDVFLSEVTPTDVANAIDRYIAGKERVQ